MRSRIIHVFISGLTVLMFTACDQTPTTFDEEPYKEAGAPNDFSMSIEQFEFDYLSQRFFFSIEINSPLGISQVSAYLGSTDLPDIVLVLNDLGQEADILIGDGHYEGAWTLPDSMAGYVDSLWVLSVDVLDSASNSYSASKSLLPELPAPPVLGMASHRDTLTLLTDALVLDTLTLKVEHPNGLDEIRDVSMISLKPDGTYANGGQPIPLYDDGGSVVFYSFGGIDFTSGDSLANDGVYSLLLALAPDNLSGVYHWTFNSRTWLGIEAIPVLDSIVVLPQASLSRQPSRSGEFGGVFK